MGDHPDYLRNLSDSKAFIRNIQKSLIEGLNVVLVENDRILVISFRPPTYYPMGIYAAPISLHQNKATVEKEREWYFNYHFQLASRFAPKQALIPF